MTGPDSSPRQAEGGFTTLELMITCLIMSVVVIMAGTALISVTNAGNRNDAVISNQQQASNVITELSRDIRSAGSLSFPTSAPSTEVQLSDNTVTGSTITTVPILWLYTTSVATCTSAKVSSPCLIRETQVSGTFTPQSTFSIALANNVSTNPVFAYYTFSSPGTPMSSGSTMAQFSTCATAIGIDLVVSRTTNNATSTFEDTDQVALTNQINTLTAPGNGNCR